jgi:hypothetical protein
LIALPTFEITRVFRPLDHVAGFIVNANHSIMGTAETATAPDKGGGERSIYDPPHMTLVFLTFNMGVLAAQL